MPSDEELNEWKGAYECYDKDKDGKDKGEFIWRLLTTSPLRGRKTPVDCQFLHRVLAFNLSLILTHSRTYFCKCHS